MRFLALALLLIITACVSGHQASMQGYQNNEKLFTPTLNAFPHCRSYGCKQVDTVSLTGDEQARIQSLFTPKRSAAEERAQIAQAIGLMEQIIGRKTGTDEDIAGTYQQLGHMQQDCVDESTNTTTYLILLNQMGLFNHHDVNAPTSRAPILSGRLGPHRTAVIWEPATQTKYAVDSWFHDNGADAEIVELDTWRWGWHPD